MNRFIVPMRVATLRQVTPTGECDYDIVLKSGSQVHSVTYTV